MADNPVLQQVKVAPTDKMVFTGTFEGETKQDLIITNTTDRVIAFKLKGTSPEIMKQRPGYGYINAKDKVAITVSDLFNISKLSINICDNFLGKNSIAERETKIAW